VLAKNIVEHVDPYVGRWLIQDCQQLNAMRGVVDWTVLPRTTLQIIKTADGILRVRVDLLTVYKRTTYVKSLKSVPNWTSQQTHFDSMVNTGQSFVSRLRYTRTEHVKPSRCKLY